MKQNDLKILSLLRKDGRQSLTELSKRTNIPVSTLHDKLKRQTPLFIKKHTCLLNFDALGYQLRMMIMLRSPDKERAALFIHDQPNINSAMKLDGDYDYVLECIFRNVAELQDFLTALQSAICLEKIKTSYVVEELARERFLEVA